MNEFLYADLVAFCFYIMTVDCTVNMCFICRLSRLCYGLGSIFSFLERICICFYFLLQITLSKELKDIYKFSRKHDLHNTAFAVMDMTKKSKSDFINKKCNLLFNKFKICCRKYNLIFLTADVSTVFLCFTDLIQSACSVSVLNSNV